MSLFEKPKNLENENLPVLCRHAYYKLHDGFSKHYHDNVEIITVVTGEMKCTADNRTYILKSGDIILFNPYTVHSGYTTAENTKHICITFTLSDVLNYHDSALGSSADLLTKGHYLFDEYYPAEQEENSTFFQHILTLYEHNLKLQSPANQMIILRELYSILAILFAKHYHPSSGKPLQKRNKQFMQNFSTYLQENYAKPITTNDAAQALFMSTSRFSYLVKQYFGCNFTKYLRQYRIENAIKNFSDSDCTIKEIAEAVGFTDYYYFSHAFKEYTGFSPASYFKKQRKAPLSSLL